MEIPPPPAKRACYRHGESGTVRPFPLFAQPYIFLRLLSNSHLGPKDLARLEACCKFLRRPAGYPPDEILSLPELAARDMCHKRSIFKHMETGDKEDLKQRCGGSWMLVLRFISQGERCYRREMSQAVAGPGHSVVVTSLGKVYTFGNNSSGQLGIGNFNSESRPVFLRSLQGIRIVQAAAGVSRTMLISDTGKVYAFGKDTYGDPEFGAPGPAGATNIASPRIVESLNEVFAVQVAIGNFFTAILSREGHVYTFSWGADARLGHQTEAVDQKPQLLRGALENVPVVQIAAGYCYLLARTCEASGMSVYSLGCGLGGKLGHGNRADERYPRLIEHFQSLKFQPITIAAGPWHAAAVGEDGRVCTWGWGRYGCLGHGHEECEALPKVVESLQHVKAVHVATGDYTTFVVAEDGDVYSFGSGESASLGHLGNSDSQAHRHANVMLPRLVNAFKNKGEEIVYVNLTSCVTWDAHTFAITKSNKLYAFGSGDKGQLGLDILDDNSEKYWPELVNIDLSS
ncbi:hypothetical protein KP509_35G022800 [Ceratopteris richardii]|uniref:RCC1-like domain-containing protein n=1 Tax=Ceratopteris richardii TaxID=49495 RepID=A0A8T2QFS3_CERRI|nr:hypothetical protein KP509_35G022800 [Ceratopteris richardii]KAH7282273.1 hypothetical protein KP509_35G022800 [Ceratopteris richardii]